MMKRLLLETKWGAKSLIALYISVVSGIVLALQYDFAHPFYSSISLDVLIPFGAFWRSLHFYSSQIFFLLSIIHFLAILTGSSHRFSMGKWIWITATLPVSLLLLFTGYVLRGDVTGESAGHIAENISLSIPLVGNFVNNLLFAISQDGMKRVYANHVIGLAVLWGVFAWDHLRRYRVRILDHPGTILFTLVLSMALTAPMELLRFEDYIAGPWFFLGLQEFLRYIHPFWAGVVFPLFFMISLVFVQEGQKWSVKARYFAWSWLFVYGIATLLALNH